MFVLLFQHVINIKTVSEIFSVLSQVFRNPLFGAQSTSWLDKHIRSALTLICGGCRSAQLGCHDCLPLWFALWPSVFCVMNSLQLTFTFPVLRHQGSTTNDRYFWPEGQFGLWSIVCILLSFRTWHWERMRRGSGWRTPCWCSSQCCSTKTMTTVTRSAQSCSISSVSTVMTPAHLCDSAKVVAQKSLRFFVHLPTVYYFCVWWGL